MKKRIFALGLVFLLLALGVGSVLAGGAGNGTLVKFLYYDYQGTEYYCEGYFLETGSGIVHEWRDNVECINWGQPITSFHLVFKPTDKFDEDDWGNNDNLMGCNPGPWTLTEAYVDLDDDEADLTDFFGERYEKTYWSCVFQWGGD